METPQIKREIIRAMEDLPDDATPEDAMERLYFSRRFSEDLSSMNPGQQSHTPKSKQGFLT